MFQDTVVALHALSVYNIRTFARDINLNISLSSSSNSQFQRELVLTQGDAAVQKSVDNVRIPVSVQYTYPAIHGVYVQYMYPNICTM